MSTSRKGRMMWRIWRRMTAAILRVVASVANKDAQGISAAVFVFLPGLPMNTHTHTYTQSINV